MIIATITIPIDIDFAEFAELVAESLNAMNRPRWRAPERPIAWVKRQLSA